MMTNTNESAHVAEIGEAGFEEALEATDMPVLVDFYAPWCGPCKMLAPLLNSLAAVYAGKVRMVKVNVDEAPGLASRYGITGVPTLMLFRGGLLLATFVGLPSARALRAKLDEFAPAEVAAV